MRDPVKNREAHPHRHGQASYPPREAHAGRNDEECQKVRIPPVFFHFILLRVTPATRHHANLPTAYQKQRNRKITRIMAGPGCLEAASPKTPSTTPSRFMNRGSHVIPDPSIWDDTKQPLR